MLSVLAWRFRRQAEDLIGYEAYAFVGLVAAANFVALWTLNQEIINYFDRQAMELGRFTAYTRDEAQAAINHKHLSMTYLWAIYGAAVIAVGLWRRVPLARWAGLAILALASLKLMALDTFVTVLLAGSIYSAHQRAIPGVCTRDRADAGFHLVAPARPSRIGSL